MGQVWTYNDAAVADKFIHVHANTSATPRAAASERSAGHVFAHTSRLTALRTQMQCLNVPKCANKEPLPPGATDTKKATSLAYEKLSEIDVLTATLRSMAVVMLIT